MKKIEDLRLKLMTDKEKEVHQRILLRSTLPEPYIYLARLFEKTEIKSRRRRCSAWLAPASPRTA